MAWPARDIRVIAEYLAKEPAPDERIEYAVAQLSSIYVNGHRKQGAEAIPLGEFLMFRKAWESADLQAEDRYSDVDRSFLKALMK